MRISAMLISASLMALALGLIASTSNFPPRKVIGWNYRLTDVGGGHNLAQRLVKA